jgi:CRP-like cAMP-binding protein
MTDRTDQEESFELDELEDVLLFKEVELESVQGILENCPLAKFRKDEVVLSAGESNHSIHLLLSGQLRVQLELSLQPIAKVKPGELVGEISVVDGEPTTAYVVAEENCRVLVLDESTLESLFETSSRIAHNLLYIVVQRLRRGDALIKALSLSGG